jgi:hypothetical protein
MEPREHRDSLVLGDGGYIALAIVEGELRGGRLVSLGLWPELPIDVRRSHPFTPPPGVLDPSRACGSRRRRRAARARVASGARVKPGRRPLAVSAETRSLAPPPTVASGPARRGHACFNRCVRAFVLLVLAPVLLVLVGCGPRTDFYERAPYCALSAPCATDQECITRYTLDRRAVCEDGVCVHARGCHEDADCEGRGHCRFVSDQAEGLGRWACVPCVSDDECGPGELCGWAHRPPGGLALVTGCVPADPTCPADACPPGLDCVHLAPGQFGCFRPCASELDCRLRLDSNEHCIEGHCVPLPCFDGADFGCGAGVLVCRNAQPFRHL